METSSIAILAISIFSGIWVYLQFGRRSISTHNIMGLVWITLLISAFYFAFDGSGIFDSLFPSFSQSVSSSPKFFENWEEDLTAEQKAIMEEDVYVENNTVCIDTYLYKGYDAISAEKLCKIQERNE